MQREWRKIQLDDGEIVRFECPVNTSPEKVARFKHVLEQQKQMSKLALEVIGRDRPTNTP